MIVSSSVKKEFLVCCWDQISLGILHADWPNIPGHSEQVNAVRTDVEDDAWPSDWPEEVFKVLDEFNDVFADKLTPERRL